MSICGSFSSLLSCCCILLTIKYTFLFPMMVVASLLLGITFCASYSSGTFFAVLWFPDNEVAIAIAFNSAAMIAGAIFGGIVPSAVLQNPPNKQNFSTFLENNSNLTQWNVETYKNLMYIYSTVAVILVLLLLLFYLFAKDLPPKAPTLALAQKRINEAELKETKSWNEFLRCSKELVQDETYLLCISLTGVIYSLALVEMLHLSQLVSTVVRDGDSSKEDYASLISGYAVLSFAASGFASAFLSAKILLHFKRHSKQIIAGTGLLLASGICILISYYYRALIGFYVGNVTWGVAVRICTIPLEDMVTRQTYPKDETVVTLWMTGSGAVIYVLMTGIARLLTSYTASSSALFFLAAMMFVIFLSSFFLKPNNSRGEADQQLTNERYNRSEYSPLIH